MVHVHVGENLCNGGGVTDVVVTLFDGAALMGLAGVVVGLSNQRLLFVTEVRSGLQLRNLWWRESPLRGVLPPPPVGRQRRTLVESACGRLIVP